MSLTPASELAQRTPHDFRNVVVVMPVCSSVLRKCHEAFVSFNSSGCYLDAHERQSSKAD